MQEELKAIQKQLVSPLNIILGCAQLLEMDDNLTSSQLNNLTEIKNAGFQLSALIEQLPELINTGNKINKDNNKEFDSTVQRSIAEPSIDQVDTCKVLIVEDNLTNQKLLVQQLEILGYESDTANDGQFALDMLAENHYALILSDLNMPRINGYQLTQKIRQSEDNKHHIIIAITANALVGEKEKCLSLGMDGYLSKPLNMKDLEAQLKKWIPARKNEGLNESKNNISKLDINKSPSTKEVMSKEIPIDIDDSDLDQYAKEAGNSLIDKSFLVRSLGDNKEKHLFIINSYLKNTPNIVKDFNQAYQDRDIKLIRFFSHKLKSSTRSIGAIALADVSETIEQAADEANWTIINQLSPQVSILFDQLKLALANDYKGL